MASGIFLPKIAVIGGTAGGLLVILTIGLLSGLVGRPNNCIPQSTNMPATTTTIPATTTTRPATTSTIPATTSTIPATTTTRPATTSTIPATTTTMPATTSTRPATMSTTTITSRPTPSLPPSTSRPTLETTPDNSLLRLPKFIQPSNIKLLIKADFDPYAPRILVNGSKNQWTRYYGEVEFTLDIKEETNRIETHVGIGINIQTELTVLQTSNDQVITLQSQNYLPNDLFEFVTQNPLQPGEYKLKVFFNSITSFIGFYKADYLENEESRSLLATRFFPNLARSAIPCFDEPGFKSTYELTIEHPARSIAVSNSESLGTVDFEEDGVTKKRTTFSKTFKMSVNILAWAIVPDDFDSKPIMVENIEIRLHGRKSAFQNNLVDFPLDIAAKVLTYYKNNLGIEEAIPEKINLIGLPGYPQKSSPSWGLNAFHEDYLFYNDGYNSVADKFRVAEIIAKELAHYWFGNYVTCEWWDEFWLNEALAIFFQYKAVGSLDTSYDIDNQFVVDRMIPAMWDDGYATSRPIIMSIESQSDLRRAFDQFIYNKGAAVIRMLESVVQESQLFDGLKKYLQSKPFGTVTSNDFYNSFTLPAELAITAKELIEPWLIQKNYPEVAVLLDNSNGQNRVRFVQDRFLLSEIDEDGVEGLKWNIYLQCRAGGQAGDDLAGNILPFNHLLTQTEEFFPLDREYTWVKCNTDFKGFYVTDYTNELFEKFESILLKNRTTFSIGDRMNLIHNAFELAFLGVKSYSIPNLFGNYLTDIETDVNPFRVFIWHINKVANIIEHRSSFKNLKGYIGEMIRTVANRLGLDIWDDLGNDLLRLLKAELAEFQCRMQEEVCLNKATELFESIPEEYFIFTANNQNLNPVHGNYRAIVYKYHLQNTYDIFDWIRVFTFAELTNNAIEREISLDALGNSRHAFLLDLYLMQLLEDGNVIKIDDYTRVLNAVGQNANGRYFAWYFVREYWYYLAFETNDPRSIAQSAKLITDSFDNLFLFEEVLLFFSDVYIFDNSDVVDQITDIVLNNVFWVANKENDFENYFFGVQK